MRASGLQAALEVEAAPPDIVHWTQTLLRASDFSSLPPGIVQAGGVAANSGFFQRHVILDLTCAP
jgi:hypothetical protein